MLSRSFAFCREDLKAEVTNHAETAAIRTVERLLQTMSAKDRNELLGSTSVSGRKTSFAIPSRDAFDDAAAQSTDIKDLRVRDQPHIRKF